MKTLPSREDWGSHSFVREDQEWKTSGEPVVAPAASLGSYVFRGELLKASQVGNPIPKQISPVVEDDYEIGKEWKPQEDRASLY